jgi:hypothetical protein
MEDVDGKREKECWGEVNGIGNEGKGRERR